MKHLTIHRDKSTLSKKTSEKWECKQQRKETRQRSVRVSEGVLPPRCFLSSRPSSPAVLVKQTAGVLHGRSVWVFQLLCICFPLQRTFWTRQVYLTKIPTQFKENSLLKDYISCWQQLPRLSVCNVVYLLYKAAIAAWDQLAALPIRRPGIFMNLGYATAQ